MTTRQQQEANELVRLVRGGDLTIAERDRFVKTYLTDKGATIESKMRPEMADKDIYRLAARAINAGY